MNINVVKGDITKQVGVDAVVNAANCMLLGGGGVDGAIHAAAGGDLFRACELLPLVDGVRCKTGSAVLTGAYDLPNNYVIHTVGPVYADYTSEVAEGHLIQCYMNSFRVAVAAGCKSISFPAISTGIYGYPLVAATASAVASVYELLRSTSASEHDGVSDDMVDTDMVVNFVCFDDQQVVIYNMMLDFCINGNKVNE